MNKDIGLRIKEIRRSSDLTQKDFAESIGITQASLSVIENGGNASIETLSKIANIYKIKMDWLLSGTKENFASDAQEKYGDQTKYAALHAIIGSEKIYDAAGVPLLNEKIKYLEAKVAFYEQLLKAKDEIIELLKKNKS